MSGRAFPLVRSRQGVLEIWWVGEDQVIFFRSGLCEFLKRQIMDMKVIRPWRSLEVFSSLCCGRLIDVDRINHDVTSGHRFVIPGHRFVIPGHRPVIPGLTGDPQRPLRRHKSNRTGSCPDVQKPPVVRPYGHGRAKQHAIGIHLHGAALIHDIEPLELKDTHYTNCPSTIYNDLSHIFARSGS